MLQPNGYGNFVEVRILYQCDFQEAHSYICSQLVSVKGEHYVQSSRAYIEWVWVAEY